MRRAADRIFERHNPYPGAGLRNHCLRLHELTCLVLERGGVAHDPDLIYLAAMLHDLGLLDDTAPGATYLERSRSIFLREAVELELDDGGRQIVEECLLFNHRVLAPPGLSAVAEGFRRAVWIEHSRGLLRPRALPRRAVAAVFARHARDDFDRVLLDFTRRVLTREPATLVRGVFF